MTESSPDMLRGGGMCEHGNEPPCQKCHSKEVRSFVETERSRELTVERIAELEQELVEATALFEDGEMEFFIAGGTCLDLFDGEWNRDHQDLDVVIFSDDRGAFYDLARRHGYEITFPEDGGRRILSKEEVEDASQHNVFLFRNDDRGQSELEVIFMDADEERVALTPDVTIDREHFNNAPTFKINDTSVRLVPPEITLYFKLRDGRRKDLEDALIVWDQLDETQHTNLQEVLSQSGTRFIVGDLQTDSVQELLDQASQREPEMQNHFFDEELETIEEELMKDVHDKMDIIHEIRQGQSSPEGFADALRDRFGGFMPERRRDIQRMTDFLFQDPPPDREAFTEWSKTELNIRERLKKMALHKFENQKVWTTE